MIKVVTRNPLAIRSADYHHPRGSKQDNTHCPKFVRQCMNLFTPVRVLDLGCAGGGLVKDFLDAGQFAVGIEGSDYPLRHSLGEWPTIPSNLFLADITQPFEVNQDGFQAKFDIVTAWEVLEHVREEDLPALFTNIREHLIPHGLFIGSISTIPDEEGGVRWHETLNDSFWWEQQFKAAGFVPSKAQMERHVFPRGSGNPLATGDWSGNEGFHVIMSLA
jgi:2-polyprenyl-3-methyl-5-hydroxy-6-metoxy-1,4-benzoquinol methylase